MEEDDRNDGQASEAVYFSSVLQNCKVLIHTVNLIFV
jgi:hypothetical protein